MKFFYSIEKPCIKLTVAEICPSDSFNNYTVKEKRAAQKTTAQEIIKQITGKKQEIDYTINGKPFIKSSSLKISVSHTDNLVAVIVNEKEETGIDLQKHTPKLVSVSHKFLSRQETEDCPGIEKLHIIWGVKEALYKAYGEKNLFFSENLLTHPFTLKSQGNLTAEITKSNYRKDYELCYEIINSVYYLVYINREL